MKKILKITLLMICVFIMSTGIVYAELLFSPSLDIDTTINGKITVTVSKELDNETILEMQKPSLSIPCDFENAHVEYDRKEIESTLENGEITFVVEKAGDYVIVKDASDDEENINDRNENNKQPSSGGSSYTQKYEIKVQENEGGKITPSTLKIKKGTDVTFQIEPEDGYEIEDVLVDGNSVGIVSSYTLEDIKKEYTIEARFKKIQEKVVWKNPFKDVSEGEWFYDAVEFTNENELLKGVSETEFAPYEEMTRGMMVTVLWRLENKPVVNYLMMFEDVDEESYYGEAVRWAASENIVNGYSAKDFRPEVSISREEVAVILYRYAKYKNKDITVGENTSILSYDDFNEISEYAIPAIAWGAGSGVITGRTIETIVPKENAIRAEVATMMMRFMKN